MCSKSDLYIYQVSIHIYGHKTKQWVKLGVIQLRYNAINVTVISNQKSKV